HGEDAPVTSCYLDVDGRRYVRPHDYELELDRLVRRARERHGHGTALGKEHSLCRDLQRFEEHLKGGLDRSQTRGLAMLWCSAQGFWRAIPLPLRVRNQLVVNRTPHVRPLETIVATNPRFAVLLADRQRARLLVFHMGELVEREERFDQLPRHDDDGGTWTK